MSVIGMLRQLTCGSSDARVAGSPMIESPLPFDVVERALTHKLSHVFVRTLAAINLADCVIQTISRGYAHAVANSPFGEAHAKWWLVSSLFLPLCLAIEIGWMWNVKIEAKALWIDGAFTLAWSLTFWLVIGYLFTHRVLFL